MNFEKKVIYTKPEDSEENEFFRHHKFEILAGEKVVSGAEVHYHAKPLPHYLLSDLYTEPFYQNQKLASSLLEEFENFLVARGKPGILVDSIMSDINEVQSMYERRGWRLIDGNCLRAFNLPEDIDLGIFKGYGMRGRQFEE